MGGQKEKNKRCFEGVFSRVVSLEEKFKFYDASWVYICSEFGGISINTIMSWHEVALFLLQGYIFDGSVVDSLGPFGIRGVIKDSLASCVLSFLDL